VKAREHGPDKVYGKFRVIKRSTGLELDPEIEFFFVLRPETDDRAALAALGTYADVCEATYPELAREIREHVSRIQRDFPEGNPAARRNGMPPKSEP
jgi:hypothetical protein